jgi:hypothetical protein
MMATVARLADRLLLAVVPKVDAGACLCRPGEYACTPYRCGPPQDPDATMRVRFTCECDWNWTDAKCAC